MRRILPRRRVRKCRKGEKNCRRFPNALAKEMIKNAARNLLEKYSSREPLISWGLRLVWNDAKKRGNGKSMRMEKVNWGGKARSWRTSRSLTEASSPCNCPCQLAPGQIEGGVQTVEEAVEATEDSSWEIIDDADKIPSVVPPAPKTTLTQKAKAKLSAIFKFVQKAGGKTLEVAKDQIKKHLPTLLDLAKKHGKVELKKYLEKQRAVATGGKQMLYEAALELIGPTNGDEKASKTGAEIGGTTDEGWNIVNQV